MTIQSSHQAYDYLRYLFQYEVEEFWAMALRSNKVLISAQCLFRGTVDHCTVHPRDIFRFAIQHNASSIIIAHNHPSGEVLPSQKDRSFTDRLRKVADLMQIPLNDHLILTEDFYLSFADQKWFKDRSNGRLRLESFGKTQNHQFHHP